MRRLNWLVIAALLLTAPMPALAQSQPIHGVALVIGQSAYSGLPTLKNPPSDAAAMGELLGRLGFSVESALDGDRAALARKFDAFIAGAASADVALIYYSGHGIEAGGENYIVPVDADLSTPEAAGATLIPVGNILDRLARAVQVTILLLDACRSDAFPPGTLIQPPGAAQPVAAQGTGLGELRGPAPIARPGVPTESLGMVIGFAASPGQPALDGAPGEPNSPYAAALLKHLGAGGYSFGDVMTLVSEEVYLKTRARQLPWVNSSLRRILRFGEAVLEGDADHAAITSGRRDLLLKIAATPDDTKSTVETLAADRDLPLAKLYGVLDGLGYDPSKSENLEALLQIASDRLVREGAGPIPSVDYDQAIADAVALAEEAEDEGAYAQSLEFLSRAVDAARELVATDASENRERQLAILLARQADREWSLFRLEEAAGHYAEAEAAVSDFDSHAAAFYKVDRADALSALAEYGGDPSYFDTAFDIYDEVLDDEANPLDDDSWADVANRYAGNLAKRGERAADDTDLDDAAHAYEQVIGIWTRNERPFDWASATNNSGNVYASLGDRNADPQYWQTAEDAYRAALEIWTKDAAPLDWARAQSNLGTVLHALGNYGKDAKELKAAIEAYRQSLRVRTRHAVPYDWAEVQNNLGNAITDLAKVTKDVKANDEGITAYRAALEVWSRDRLPLLWATAQNNIGATYATMARQQKGDAARDSFNQAVAAYRLCLEERTEARDPRMWALTQYNLGLVLTDLAGLEDGVDALQQAVEAFNASLEVYGEYDSPVDWADAQDGRGWALAQLGYRNHDASLVEQGRNAMQRSFDYYRDYDGAASYFEERLDQIDEWLRAVS